MFKKRIMGMPAWLVIIVALIIFRKRIPMVDKAFESVKGMVSNLGGSTQTKA